MALLLILILTYVSYRYGMERGRTKERLRLRKEWEKILQKQTDLFSEIGKYRFKKKNL